ncbi:hypothetical protein COX84_05265, partial [Candidatus Micrarchaeota archaeon CG_4_10_14_0_2_um_filter_49_7]
VLNSEYIERWGYPKAKADLKGLKQFLYHEPGIPKHMKTELLSEIRTRESIINREKNFYVAQYMLERRAARKPEHWLIKAMELKGTPNLGE